MILYRFTHKKYVDISGAGARLNGGRWNSKGIPVVYTSATISLSLLELLIHSSSYNELNSNFLMEIEVPGDRIDRIPDLSLPSNWENDIDYSRLIGNEFIKSKLHLFLKVPSALIPREFNFLINPLHPDIKKVKIITAAPFQFDSRLLK